MYQHYVVLVQSRKENRGFPGVSVGKESTCSARDPGLIPGSGRSPRDGNGNLLQNSWLENPMDRGFWRASVHGVARVGKDLATKPPGNKTDIIPVLKMVLEI